jgi:hypothetical protein
MRHARAYTRRQRAVTFVGSTRAVTIPLETVDFEQLERFAAKHNIGNATLGRQIICKYLKRQARERSLARVDAVKGSSSCGIASAATVPRD